MKRFIVLILALVCLSLPAGADPFAKDTTLPTWPQRIAPTEVQLKKLKEPSLKGAAPPNTIDIRFIWVPTFKSPFAVRATSGEGKYVLRVVRMKGKGGYDWGAINIERNIELTEVQWKLLVSLASVDGAREPSQKTIKEVREHFVESLSELDGSTWFLEVRDQKGYTVEGVPNPIMGGSDRAKSLKEWNLDLNPFVAVCMKLFDLSGLDDRPTY